MPDATCVGTGVALGPGDVAGAWVRACGVGIALDGGGAEIGLSAAAGEATRGLSAGCWPAVSWRGAGAADGGSPQATSSRVPRTAAAPSGRRPSRPRGGIMLATASITVLSNQQVGTCRLPRGLGRQRRSCPVCRAGKRCAVWARQAVMVAHEPADQQSGPGRRWAVEFPGRQGRGRAAEVERSGVEAATLKLTVRGRCWRGHRLTDRGGRWR